MTYKPGRIHLLEAAAAMIAVLALGIITAAWAQMTGQRQSFGKQVDASAQAKPWQGPPVHFGKAVGYDTAGNTQARMPQMVAVGDLNGDGVADVAVASMCQPLEGDCYGQDMDIGAISVLIGNGDGTLQPPVVYQSGGFDSYSVVVADVNGDGRPDLVVTNYCQDFECTLNGSVGVLGNIGYGFGRASTYDSGGPDAYTLAVGDVNGDGKPDIVVANLGSLGVLLGNGNGTFQAAVTYSSGAGWANSVVIADVNGDGKADIVVANSVPDSVGVLLGNGDGTFQPAALYSSGGRTLAVAVADVNGDGKPDIVATNGDNSVGVLLGNGDGTFQAVAVYGTGGLTPVSVALADVNGDGYPDIVVTGCTNCFSTWDGVVEVLLGKGDGTFRRAVSYGEGAGTGPTSVALGDLNGDGKLDIVVANQYTNTVGVLLNNSGFATTTDVISSINPSVLNQPVTFTATVTSKHGAIPDGEPVTFYDGLAKLASVPLSGGTAAYTTASLSAKQHIIKAVYAGYRVFKRSEGRVRQVVDK